MFALERIREHIDLAEARLAVREALIALAEHRVEAPDELGLIAPEGELHVKGAYVKGSQRIAFKIATGFPGNADRGLPVNSGFSVVLDARTGIVDGILADGGWLTDLRTASAGAVAADLLAQATATRVAVLGAGAQAGWQLRALREVRMITTVSVWNRNRSRAEQLATAREWDGLEMTVADTVQQAVDEAQIIITTTPSREPLLRAEWIAPGAHVTAMGSDFPDKQELDVGVLAAADRVVADSVAVCSRVGEVHHALEAGAIDRQSVIELGDIAAGRVIGRRNDREVTVCDQCGLGVYDAAVAEIVINRLTGQR